MKILDDLISTLDFNSPVRDIRQGVFHTAVLTRNCGLAATLPRDALRQKPPLVKEAGSLTEKSVEELVHMAYRESLLEAAIGIATINSLLEIEEPSCVELNAADLIIERGKGKRIAIVGHFPFISRVHQGAAKLWVIEKNPVEEDLPEVEADNVIPQADVVGITGTALTNHTLDHLLRLCNPDAYIIILGDSAPLSPIFFDHGVDAVAGTKVIDRELALRCVSEGANFRQIKGTKRLIMAK